MKRTKFIIAGIGIGLATGAFAGEPAKFHPETHVGHALGAAKEDTKALMGGGTDVYAKTRDLTTPSTVVIQSRARAATEARLLRALAAALNGRRWSTFQTPWPTTTEPSRPRSTNLCRAVEPTIAAQEDQCPFPMSDAELDHSVS